ncbi:3-hydroxyacyl-CoA dehydrogenase NAD-binding domain-containing protein [Bifidobacterium bombi]|uniref:3-hydroxyacyl-CoA dehydrogenase NAD-binding domain-containing protein n=1 Tax=Bifidobacterium bombi TaxID=471511 RepID=UPI0005C78B0E|nr:3-hydroxyacyl-CoA dehydrogenase NAD-binding domain-containing protein [Bifidobacterium bombi]
MGLQLGDIRRIGNLGAGTMGHATALQFAMNGYDVTLVNTSQEALERGTKLIERDVDTFISAGSLKTEERSAVLQRVHATTDYGELSDVDFVIESVIEDMDVSMRCGGRSRE